MVKGERALSIILRTLGAIDALALVAVLMPGSWMAKGHAWAGLGEWPSAPVVGYLARSSSALYGLHGAMILFISFDVSHYRRLITFLAVAALIHGMVMLGIDLKESMPAHWTMLEGPAFAATGMVVLVVQRKGCDSGEFVPPR